MVSDNPDLEIPKLSAGEAALETGPFDILEIGGEVWLCLAGYKGVRLDGGCGMIIQGSAAHVGSLGEQRRQDYLAGVKDGAVHAHLVSMVRYHVEPAGEGEG